VPGKHDDLGLRADFLDLQKRLVAVHARHLDVQDDDVVGGFFQDFDRLFPVPARVVANPLRFRSFEVVARNWASSSTISTDIFWDMLPFLSGKTDDGK